MSLSNETTAATSPVSIRVPTKEMKRINREYTSLRHDLDDAYNAYYKVAEQSPETEEEVNALPPEVRAAYDSWEKAWDSYFTWEKSNFDYLCGLRDEQSNAIYG